MTGGLAGPHTVAEAADAIRSGQIRPSDLVCRVLDRIRSDDPALNCYGTVVEDRSRRHADALDRLLAAGIYLGPLHGIPVAVKDNIDTKGIPTTSGAVLDKDRVPTRDATVIQRLHAAGAVVVGKANMYEWAYGAPSTLWGDVANPWNHHLTSGASSNGSAAAVAAGLALASLGTDLGGSIRIPAAMCGIFGLKPTTGRVSRAGVMPSASTLDHVGPMTRTATDAALLLACIAGPDVRDARTLGGFPVADYAVEAQSPVDGLRLGVLRAQEHFVLDAETEGAFQKAQRTFRDLGCSVVEVELPDLEDARTLMWVISAVEGAEFHRENLLSDGGSYNPDVRALLNTGAFIAAPDYARCQRVRQLLMEQMARVFGRVDAVLTPVLPMPPWSASAREVTVGGVVEDKMSAMTHYSPLFNLTGHPAAAMLAGFTSDGLPLSVQLAAPMYAESTILRLAAAFERATGLTTRRPPAVPSPVELTTP